MYHCGWLVVVVVAAFAVAAAAIASAGGPYSTCWPAFEVREDFDDCSARCCYCCCYYSWQSACYRTPGQGGFLRCLAMRCSPKSSSISNKDQKGSESDETGRVTIGLPVR